MEILTNAPPPQAPIADVKGLRFIPDSDCLLVALDDPEERTKGGLYIPDQYKKKVQTGVVVEVGPGRWDNIGSKLVPMTKAVGDRVLISKMAGTPMIIDDKEVLLTNEREVLGTFVPRKEGEKLPIDDLPSFKEKEKKRKEELAAAKAKNGESSSPLILPSSAKKEEEGEKRISLVGGEIPEKDPQVVVAKPARAIKCNLGGCDRSIDVPGEASDGEVRTTIGALGWSIPIGYPRGTGLCPEHSGKK